MNTNPAGFSPSPPFSRKRESTDVPVNYCQKRIRIIPAPGKQMPTYNPEPKSSPEDTPVTLRSPSASSPSLKSEDMERRALIDMINAVSSDSDAVIKSKPLKPISPLPDSSKVQTEAGTSFANDPDLFLSNLLEIPLDLESTTPPQGAGYDVSSLSSSPQAAGNMTQRDLGAPSQFNFLGLFGLDSEQYAAPLATVQQLTPSPLSSMPTLEPFLSLASQVDVKPSAKKPVTKRRSRKPVIKKPKQRCLSPTKQIDKIETILKENHASHPSVLKHQGDFHALAIRLSSAEADSDLKDLQKEIKERLNSELDVSLYPIKKEFIEARLDAYERSKKQDMISKSSPLTLLPPKKHSPESQVKIIKAWLEKPSIAKKRASRTITANKGKSAKLTVAATPKKIRYSLPPDQQISFTLTLLETKYATTPLVQRHKNDLTALAIELLAPQEDNTMKELQNELQQMTQQTHFKNYPFLKREAVTLRLKKHRKTTGASGES